MEKNHILRQVILSACISIPAICSFAQKRDVEVGFSRQYITDSTPDFISGYIYAGGQTVKNLSNYIMYAVSGDITELKVSPAAPWISTALHVAKEKKGITSFNASTARNIKTKGIYSPTACCYSPDGKSLYIANDSAQIKIYNPYTMAYIDKMDVPFVPCQIALSDNGYFISAAHDKEIVVMNIEKKQERKRLAFNASVKRIEFSKDSQHMGALTADGKLSVFDTRQFALVTSFDCPESAEDFKFHPDNKYVAVITDPETIEFYNLFDKNEAFTMKDYLGGMRMLHFLETSTSYHIARNNAFGIGISEITNLTPNHSQLLLNEMKQRMDEWTKIHEGETVDQYKKRVNTETTKAQAKLFEQEIATKMAEGTLEAATVKLGGYNRQTGALALEFDKMPSVYLTVPEDEVKDFMDTAQLQFRKAKYGINENDNFELTYVEVVNKVTGKVYEFNNLERHSLDFLSANDDFTPIELIQQSSMEEVKLNAIKKKVVETAKHDNIISDHTKIDVNTNVTPDVDADGNKIMNYNVNFSYTVDGEYSMTDDFPSGKYFIEQSHAAESMLKIVTTAFETDFAQYIKEGKKVIVSVTGSADASPVTGKIAYDSRYGVYENIPYRLNNKLSTITVTKSTGITSNEQLAFMRAVAVKSYIQKNLTNLQNMNTDYRYNIELSDKTGGEYRRITVGFTFVDAF